ncbi:hypothetical protein C0991_007125 [Blastosporella zonata]|nr:hypothetical protein C0991_007125 [Blastosporella zonata]
MASLAYVSVPSSATRLQSPPPSFQRLKKFTTSLPTPTPPPSLGIPAMGSSSTTIPAQMTSPTSAAFALLPQMLLSSALPGPTTSPTPTDSKDTRKGPLLLTTKDPLSIPITTANFKRFVAKSGNIFWIQDRIEEVVMWKRGWRITAVWMAAYAFFCYFPKMVFAIPHMVLIAIMLASYPYSSKSKSGETSSQDSVNWQGNLQAIQNLMGFIADAYDLIQPHTHLLLLSPAHLPSVESPAPSSPSPSISPYPPLIFLSLLLTFPPLVALLASSFFPTRLVCLVGGLAPVVAFHPRIRPLLGPLANLIVPLAEKALMLLVRRYTELSARFTKNRRAVVDEQGNEPLPLKTILDRLRDNDRLDDTCWSAEMREVELWENERFVSRVRPGVNNVPVHMPAYPDGTGIDANAKLTHSPAASFSGLPSDSPLDMTPRGSKHHRFSLPPLTMSNIIASTPEPADSGWSKVNLRSGERRAWTRGQDGWGGIRSRSGSADEEQPPQQQRMENVVDTGEEGVVRSGSFLSSMEG